MANWAIASRYALVAFTTITRALFDENPRERAAISKLAAKRLMSHSNGAGFVSSKSLMSNTSARSGDAKPPKFER